MYYRSIFQKLKCFALINNCFETVPSSVEESVNGSIEITNSELLLAEARDGLPELSLVFRSCVCQYS